MITRIFDKSKPINFVIVLLVVLVVFTSLKIKTFSGNFNISYLLEEAFVFLLCLANLAVLNFVVSKNSLTKKNSYKILLFSLFLAMMPFAINNPNVLVSNLIVLLALRRIVSLRSQIKVKKKLLDSTVLIVMASLFYFWSILFLLLVIVGLIFYSNNQFKNWLVPLVGVLAMVILYVAFHIIKNNTLGNVNDYFQSPSFNFSIYNTPKLITGITILISFGLWASIFYIKNITNKLKSFRPSFIIILIMALLALILTVVSNNKDGSEWIFLFAPLSIIITNYIEVIEEKWFKELFLIVLILIPIAFQFL